MNFASIKRLTNLHLIKSVDNNNSSQCPIYIEAKFVKKPFKPILTRSTELIKLIHSNIVDFKHTASKCGKKYYITLVDDFSRYTKVYLLRSKDEAA